MNRIQRIALAMLLLGCACYTTTRADVVVLSDGSRLLGTVQRMDDQTIILETQFAGTLEIDAKAVVQVETEQPVNVGVDTGDRLVGPIAWQPAIERAVVKSELGDIPVDIDRIDAIWPVGDKSPEEIVHEERIKQLEEEARAAQGHWTATFELGMLYQEGNTDRFNVQGRAELARKWPDDLIKFYLAADYQEENDQRDAHEVKAGTYYEHLLTKRWFTYARLDLEYDEFEDIDLRLSAIGGIGYYWIKQDDHELKTRGGVGYLHETFNDGTQEDAAQAELALEYRVDIAPWLRFTHATSYYPTFETIRDYRLVSDTGFIFPIGDSDVWKVKLGAKYEYDARPNPGQERLDQTYYSSILAEIK